MSSRENISNQLESYSTPLKISSENPFEEFQIPKETLENRKIIGMGEATHSTKEFHQVRRRFFRFLVEELDYRIFAWEASFGETLEINNYVVNGEGTAEEALSSISSPIFRTEEILELVKWVRNITNRFQIRRKSNSMVSICKMMLLLSKNCEKKCKKLTTTLSKQIMRLWSL